jgi:hypothetical protein
MDYLRLVRLLADKPPSLSFETVAKVAATMERSIEETVARFSDSAC